MRLKSIAGLLIALFGVACNNSTALLADASMIDTARSGDAAADTTLPLADARAGGDARTGADVRAGADARAGADVRDAALGDAGAPIDWGSPGDPVLFFSDLESGPSTGNSDTSMGQAGGANGTIVTIWGRGLGAMQGASTVTCNGAVAAAVYSWGNATAPANLYASHGMQAIAFQIAAGSTPGLGEISVTVGGRRSNALPFTVRPGNIRFVKTSGNDSSGDGSWTRPWRSMPHAVGTISAGDTVYVGDGVSQTTLHDYNATLDLGAHGTAGRPMALVAYPGAVVNVGSTSIERAIHFFESGFGWSEYWVISKMRITAGAECVNMSTGYRVVGSWVTSPTGTGATGCVNPNGNDVAVLGNEFTDVGEDGRGSSKLYHVVYSSGERAGSGPRLPTESNRDIGWNYFHQNHANRAINIYSEQASAAFIADHRVHDNVIVDQDGDGILIGKLVTGDNEVFNNVLIRVGLGAGWDDDDSTHAGMQLNCGDDSMPRTTLRIFNNTIVSAGRGSGSENGAFLFGPCATNADVSIINNVIVVTRAADPYVASASEAYGDVAGHNVWFGGGAAPRWDATAVTGDPMLTNIAAADARLRVGSSAINTGDNTAGAAVGRDVLGIARPQGASADIGAYEYSP